MNELSIRSVSDVEQDEVARVLSHAFGHGDSGVEEWQILLEREFTSRRADPERSSVLCLNSSVVAACIVNVGPLGLGRIGPTGVMPSLHRKGYGRSLVKQCLQHLLDAGVSYVSLEVASDNHPAINMYEGLGFEPFRRLCNLSARRPALKEPLGTVQVKSMPPNQAFDLLEKLSSDLAPYQRRHFYTRTFEAGVSAWGAWDGTDWVGAVVLRGRDILDIGVCNENLEAVSALCWAASNSSWVQRMIHVVQNSAIAGLLMDAGFDVESQAVEMVRGTL